MQRIPPANAARSAATIASSPPSRLRARPWPAQPYPPIANLVVRSPERPRVTHGTVGELVDVFIRCPFCLAPFRARKGPVWGGSPATVVPDVRVDQAVRALAAQHPHDVRGGGTD